MLQLIRGTVGSWIVKILFVLLIVSFGVWGIGDIFRNAGRDTTAAEVGGRDISVQDLDQVFRQQVARLRPLFGGQFDLEQAQAMGLVEQALQQVVQRTLIDHAAADAGLRVTDDLVRQRIAQEPAFRNPQGQFDPEQFRRVLTANNLSEQGYVTLLRQDTAREFIIGAVAAGAQAPKPLVDALFRFRQEARIAEVVTITHASFGNVGTPDEAALQALHTEKAVRFTAPEYRALTVASLTVDDLAQEVAVAEEDVRAAYDSRIGEFRTPERRTVEQVLANDRETAEKIAQAVRSGQSLADAAKAGNTEPMPVGQVAREDLPEELAGAVFATPPGGIAGPVQSPLGWHVLAVTAIDPEKIRPYAEVREQLLTELRRENAADRLFEVSNKLEDALAGGTPLNELAGRFGLKLASIPAVDASGRAADGRPVAGTAALPQVLQTAFGLEKGKESRLTEAQDSSHFIVRVDEITPPRLRPLAEVRDQVVAAWQAEQRAKQAAAKAEEVSRHLREGSASDAVAKAAGGQASTTKPLTRDAQDTDLPADLVKTLFDLKPGEVATAQTANTQVVARLKEIRQAEPTEDSAALDPLRQEVTKALAGDLLDQFGDALRRKYPVEIHRETIDAMYRRN